MESPQSKPSKNHFWRILLAPVFVMAVLLFWFNGVFNKFENVLWDNFLNFQIDFLNVDKTKQESSENPNYKSNILIVEIDSKSINAIDNWPWNRNVYSDILKKLSAGNASSIFIDVDFSSSSNNPQDDRKLGQTIQKTSKTIPIRLPAFLQKTSTNSNTLSIRRPIFQSADNIEHVAVNIRPSDDGLVREVTSGFNWEGKQYRSAWNAIIQSNISSTIIDYSIPANSFNYLSVIDLLNQSIRPNQFKGMHVLIGSTAIELGDIMPAPVVQAVPGVVLHALAVKTLERGGLYSLSSAASFVLLLLLALLCYFCFKPIHWAKGITLGATLFFSLLPLHYFFYHHLKLIIPIFPIASIIVAVYLSNLILQLDENLIQKIVLQVALSNRNKLLDSIFLASNECILCVNEKGIIFSANPRSRDIFSCAGEKLIGKPINIFLPINEIDNLDIHKKPFDSTLKNINNMEIPVEICISPIDSTNEKNFTLAIRSLEERKEKEAQLKYALEYDKTTGLMNREKFFSIFKEKSNTFENCYLVRVDIEYFNDVISHHGHTVADQVLQNIIKRVTQTIPDHSIISRIDKSELAILIDNKNIEQINQLASNLSSDLNQDFFVNDNNIEIFCHLGLSALTGQDDDIESLIRRSNTALITARRKGLAFDWSVEEEASKLDRLSILGAIRKTLRRSEFELAFQPKYDMKTSTFMSCEVLLRTQHNWDPSINIATLIETAEKSSLIAPLTLWVITKVLSLEPEWKKYQLPKKVSINLSVGLIGNNNFLEELIYRIKNSNHYFDITFEITETYFSDNWQRSLKNLDKLRAQGIEVSVDDYGTGYSSLSYLKDLQASELKIDRGFISNIDKDKDKQLIVLSTIKMAHELGMTVVAEGIETETENNFLIDANCDLGQGYLYARPMPFSEFKKFSPPILGSRLRANSQ
ncbi:MAG: EAL domain-containing protein [Cellvibrionaceae bacterium]